MTAVERPLSKMEFLLPSPPSELDMQFPFIIREEDKKQQSLLLQQVKEHPEHPDPWWNLFVSLIFT